VAEASRAWPAHGWHALALGGGGLGRGLVHFFLFRLIFRAVLSIWRVPVFGPVIDIVLGLVIITLIVLRARLGPGWWQRWGGRSGRGGSSAWGR
jgi:hypothetical protein